MANLFKRTLKQDVTYWSTGEAHFGGFTFGSPVVTQGRWEERAVLFRTASGEELTSQAVVFLLEDVSVGDYMALGDQSDVTDPTTLSNAFRVMQFQKIPDLRNIQNERKAYL